MTFVRAKIPSREHCIGFMKQKWKYILQKKKKEKKAKRERNRLRNQQNAFHNKSGSYKWFNKKKGYCNSMMGEKELVVFRIMRIMSWIAWLYLLLLIELTCLRHRFMNLMDNAHLLKGTRWLSLAIAKNLV